MFLLSSLFIHHALLSQPKPIFVDRARGKMKQLPAWLLRWSTPKWRQHGRMCGESQTGGRKVSSYVLLFLQYSALQALKEALLQDSSVVSNREHLHIYNSNIYLSNPHGSGKRFSQIKKSVEVPLRMCSQFVPSTSVPLSSLPGVFHLRIWHDFSVGLRFVENPMKSTNLRPDKIPVPSPPNVFAICAIEFSTALFVARSLLSSHSARFQCGS